MPVKKCQMFLLRAMKLPLKPTKIHIHDLINSSWPLSNGHDGTWHIVPSWIGFVPHRNIIHKVGTLQLNNLEDKGQGQRSLRVTHPLLPVIICAKYGKNSRFKRFKIISSPMYRHHSYKSMEQCQNKSNISWWVWRTSLRPSGRYHKGHHRTLAVHRCAQVRTKSAPRLSLERT